MSTRLVILGILRDRPLHGYEIKKVIEDHMADWTSIAFGSIYFAIDRMADEGLIEKISVEQHGNRPSRNVYQITENGRKEFIRLLRDTWNDVEHTYFSLDIGLFFLSALPVEEVKKAVGTRIAKLAAARERLSFHEKSQMANASVPSVAEAIFSHTRFHVDAELSWTKYLLERLERGEYA
jgi:DNA-binding PadR family transcriptional regulator